MYVMFCSSLIFCSLLKIILGGNGSAVNEMEEIPSTVTPEMNTKYKAIEKVVDQVLIELRRATTNESRYDALAKYLEVHIPFLHLAQQMAQEKKYQCFHADKKFPILFEMIAKFEKMKDADFPTRFRELLLLCRELGFLIEAYDYNLAMDVNNELNIDLFHEIHLLFDRFIPQDPNDVPAEIFDYKQIVGFDQM
uniref:Uncharacterized protein n=1 Tax=Clastoptera arizonana TaxID=38151 RepID=A0A1B6DMW3_9HEMI